MNPLLHGRNRLLFRSYLILAGGLLVVAIVLDFGFGLLQDRTQPDVDRWLESTFHLIESRLASAPAEKRDGLVAEIGRELGVGVQLLAPGDIHQPTVPAHQLIPLVDADGNTSYLHEAGSIGAIIRLGPIAEPKEDWLPRLLPPIFYFSIFVIVGLWLRPLLRDIDIISGGVQRFAADYREPLATADRTSELTPLAKNLDTMAARLAGVLRSQKELIAALSHEMRTPLARLRFALAVSGDKADDAMKEKLHAMNDDVQEIDALIGSMLNYARLDHPDIGMHWQAVPASAWLGKIVEKTSPGSIGMDLHMDGIPDTIRIDPRLMELALSNLLVNAVRYAKSSIRCSLGQDAGDVVLIVEDDGQGISEHDRETVFKAFSRIDDSRNRETGGYGLGLAVVARVAELHGGSATVDASPDLGGARFSIRWPA